MLTFLSRSLYFFSTFEFRADWSQGNNSSLYRVSDYLQSFASALSFPHILPLLWSPNKILPHGILRFSNGSRLNPSNCLHSRFDYVILPVKPSAFWYIDVVFIWIPIQEVSYLWILLMYFGESITCNWLPVHFFVLFFPLRKRDAGKGGKGHLGFSLWLLPISYSLSFVWPSLNLKGKKSAAGLPAVLHLTIYSSPQAIFTSSHLHTLFYTHSDIKMHPLTTYSGWSNVWQYHTKGVACYHLELCRLGATC